MMWPFGSNKTTTQKDPEVADLRGIYENEALVALRVADVTEVVEGLWPYAEGKYTVLVEGFEGFHMQYKSSGHPPEGLRVREHFIVSATKQAIEDYRKHLQRLATLDLLVERELKEGI